jgi:sporulation protein YlmC with PRC-barrel domain
MRLELGTPIHCSDAEIGELADVVIDPLSKQITHVVVRTTHGKVAPSRLIPIELVDRGAEGEIRLTCTSEEASKLDPVQDFAYVKLDEMPVDDPKWDVGIERALALPYYQTDDPAFAYPYDDHVGVTYDRVPKGEVEVRRSSVVSTSDDEAVGHVDGFLVDDSDCITHIVLARGHLWKKREITIPLNAIDKVETDMVTLKLTKKELGELPAVKVRRFGS